MNFRQKLRQNKFIKFFSSVKLAVSCLVLLFILTFWGTVAQVHEGLYIAQERYFHSFFFLALGFLPFPGGQAVMWVLFVNLSCVALVRLNYKWRNIGLIIIHFGLLLFLLSGYVMLRCAQEGYLSLSEGQISNLSTAYNDWELSIWEASTEGTPQKYTREITAVDTDHLKADQGVQFKQLGFLLKVKEYYRNCTAYMGGGGTGGPINASGIQRLIPVDLEKSPEKNTPGGIFSIQTPDGKNFDILFFGNETLPTSFKVGEKEYHASLRLARHQLPFPVKLIDFMMEQHPGTETPRSFKSQVAIETNGAWREKLISMNNPLRYKDYTIYQASYAIDQMGNESSTLAVVRNVGRFMPYVSTFVTFAGLVIHFLMMALNSKKKFEPPYVDPE